MASAEKSLIQSPFSVKTRGLSTRSLHSTNVLALNLKCVNAVTSVRTHVGTTKVVIAAASNHKSMNVVKCFWIHTRHVKVARKSEYLILASCVV